MDIQSELSFISPSSTQVGDQEIFYLSVRQVLTFLERSADLVKLQAYLISEHGQANQELISLYQGFSVLLNLPKDEKDQETKPKTNFGENASRDQKSELSITPTILAVGKLAGLSWNEVLDMSIAHYNLILRQLKENQDAEREAYEKAKRSKK